MLLNAFITQLKALVHFKHVTQSVHNYFPMWWDKNLKDNNLIQSIPTSWTFCHTVSLFDLTFR